MVILCIRKSSTFLKFSEIISLALSTVEDSTSFELFLVFFLSSSSQNLSRKKRAVEKHKTRFLLIYSSFRLRAAKLISVLLAFMPPVIFPTLRPCQGVVRSFGNELRVPNLVVASFLDFLICNLWEIQELCESSSGKVEHEILEVSPSGRSYKKTSRKMKSWREGQPGWGCHKLVIVCIAISKASTCQGHLFMNALPW